MIRRSRGNRYTLLPSQHRAIHEVAQALPPTMRHAFLLRVERQLQVSRQALFPSNPLVEATIVRALDEIGAPDWEPSVHISGAA